MAATDASAGKATGAATHEAIEAIEAIEAAIEAAWQALHQGDLFRVLDLVQIGEGATRPRRLAHLEVLARARLGDLDQALELYQSHDLAQFDDLDAQALGARLLKDQALRDRPLRPEAFVAVADAYEAVFEHFGAAYPLVNAASAALLAGQGERAQRLARRTLERLPAEPGTYFDWATRAEAQLVTGAVAEAHASLETACRQEDANHSARASTRRQLELLARTMDFTEAERLALLRPLMPQPVLVTAGQMFEAAPALEAEIRSLVMEALASRRPATAYGSLARGSDIVMAECLIAAGIELHVVLPFREADFAAHAVGERWQARYAACLVRAASVIFATDGEYVGDPHQLRYGADVAMGLARIRARQLDAEAFQLAVWDGLDVAAGLDGIAADMALWQRSGGVTQALVPAASWPREAVVAGADASGDGHDLAGRTTKAILFADFPGFSKLPESLLPVFWREVMRRIADVLDRYGPAVAYRNTWGDALYAVVDRAELAVAIAFDLQDALAQVDGQMLRIDSSAQMRIGLHLGPVYRGRDFVTGAMNYYGTEVSRTARIEPITPPGAIYVTEPFAAILALEDPRGFSSRYVGQLALAKGYGAQRMYRVSRVG